MSKPSGPVQLIPRPNEERGGGNHGWLKTFHTFSFANYGDSAHTSFGSLRVINEDRVEPATGFGTHGHQEFEIFSYIVSGELQHNDSMGNTEVLKRGDLQMTSAGTGIRHSEHAHGSDQVHFLQIWSLPSESKLTPKYFTRHFTDEEKKDKWATIVAPVKDPSVTLERTAPGPAPVHSPLTLSATLLSPFQTLPYVLSGAGPQRKAYVHVIQTSGYKVGPSTGATVKFGAAGQDVQLKEGDGLYVHAPADTEFKLENVGDRVAEVLLFNLD
ncbi:pirin domain-containing protein [Amylostereum chailletii]|nr:pirin domain-containing protein [Amylostereum chailletii]